MRRFKNENKSIELCVNDIRYDSPSFYIYDGSNLSYDVSLDPDGFSSIAENSCVTCFKTKDIKRLIIKFDEEVSIGNDGLIRYVPVEE